MRGYPRNLGSHSNLKLRDKPITILSRNNSATGASITPKNAFVPKKPIMKILRNERQLISPEPTEEE